MMTSLHKLHHCRGLSLIELMVAMVIGLILLGGVISMFITNKRIYTEQDEMGRLQENARFAMQMLIEDIRMAGYAGCADEVDEVENRVNGMTDDDELLSFQNAVEGVDEADPASPSNSPWEASDSEDQVVNMVAGTDAISVRYLDPTGIQISSPMPNVSAELKVTPVGDLLSDGDIIAVSDCESADIIQLTNVQTGSNHLQHNAGGGTTPGNATQALQKKYNTDAEVLRFVARRYFIGTGAGGGPSLFRLENQDAAAQELIEGVENMEILYGEDTVGNDFIAETYVDAANVTNWDNVVSVRLWLLFRTVDETFSNPIDTRTYNMAGVNFDPADDHRRRRVVTNTIQIRNRSN